MASGAWQNLNGSSGAPQSGKVGRSYEVVVPSRDGVVSRFSRRQNGPLSALCAAGGKALALLKQVTNWLLPVALVPERAVTPYTGLRTLAGLVFFFPSAVPLFGMDLVQSIAF